MRSPEIKWAHSRTQQCILVPNERASTSPALSPIKLGSLRSASRLGASFVRRGPRKSPNGVSGDFRRQTRAIAAQLKQRDTDRVFVIDPRESAILSFWDGVTTIALVYTALLTPFEVGFLQASTTIDAWFIINRVLDLIFVADMGLQFFVVYQSTHIHSGDSAWVTERKRIARHYLFGWFPLDILSILPSVFDYIPLLSSSDGGTGDAVSVTEKLTGFRAIRALRLVKLVRLVRASRLLTRWKARVGISYGMMTLVKIVAQMIIAAHWYACVLALQATLHDDPYGTWLGHFSHCYDTPLSQRSGWAAELPRLAPRLHINATVEDLTAADVFELQVHVCVCACMRVCVYACVLVRECVCVWL